MQPLASFPCKGGGSNRRQIAFSEIGDGLSSLLQFARLSFDESYNLIFKGNDHFIDTIVKVSPERRSGCAEGCMGRRVQRLCGVADAVLWLVVGLRFPTGRTLEIIWRHGTLVRVRLLELLLL